MKKKVLFVTYGGGHVNLLLPVIIEIKKNLEIESTVLGLSIAGKVLSQYNIDYKGFKDFFDINKDSLILSYAKALASKWHVPDKEIPLEESMAYLGISMRDLVDNIGEEEAWKQVNELERKAFLPIAALKEIILRVKPDLIVTTNSPRAERAATLAGKELGISTLNIDDYLEFEPRHTLEADYIAVMCEITRENLIKKGHNPEKIIITGQPAFDKMITEIKDFLRKKIIKNLNQKFNFKFTVNDKFILFGTHHLPIMPKVIEAVIKSLLGLRNYYLLIKPHPGEVADFHKEMINKYSSSAFLIENYPIRELIYISELMITFASTVGLETVLMKKPLITINLTGQDNPIPLYKYGVALEITKEENILKGVESLLNSKNLRCEMEKNSKKYFGNILTGKAAYNIVQLILQILKKSEIKI